MTAEPLTSKERETLTTLLERASWHNDAEVRLLARILIGRVFDERDDDD